VISKSNNRRYIETYAIRDTCSYQARISVFFVIPCVWKCFGYNSNIRRTLNRRRRKGDGTYRFRTTISAGQRYREPHPKFLGALAKEACHKEAPRGRSARLNASHAGCIAETKITGRYFGSR